MCAFWIRDPGLKPEQAGRKEGRLLITWQEDSQGIVVEIQALNRIKSNV